MRVEAEHEAGGPAGGRNPMVKKAAVWCGLGVLAILAFASCVAESTGTSAGPASSDAPVATPTPPGSAAPATTTPAPAPAPAPDAVRSVDFESFSYPADACHSTQQVDPIVLVDGKTVGEDLPTEGPNQIVAFFESVAYGDATGDRIDDAVVLLTCKHGGGNAVWSVPHVFGPGPTASDPVHLGALMEDGVPERAVELVSFVDGKVLTSEFVWLETDGTCCPSAKSTTLWAWVDGAFHVDSQPTYEGLKPLALDGISVDGLDTIRLGMSSQELREATGIEVELKNDINCGQYYVATNAPDGIELFFDGHGNLRAIDVTSPTYATLSGANTNSTALDLQRLYPSRLTFFDWSPSSGQYAVISEDRSRGVFFSLEDGGQGPGVSHITVTYGSEALMDLRC